MASTVQGERLTDAHRVVQAQITAQTVARLIQIWPLLDLDDLDNTTRRWLTAAVPIVASARGASAATARQYLALFALAETGQRLTVPVTAAPAPVAAIEASLVATGPVRVKLAMTAGTDLARASETASATSAAAGSRHAIDGGRQVILEEATSNPQITSIRRVTSAGACDFCKTIASYSASNIALQSAFKTHDGCNCQPEPQF